jgi:hypothetical protein
MGLISLCPSDELSQCVEEVMKFAEIQQNSQTFTECNHEVTRMARTHIKASGGILGDLGDMIYGCSGTRAHQGKDWEKKRK